MSEEDTLAGIGEFVISLVIGYFGALEFFFVIRQLVHWSGGHQTDGAQNAQDLERLQDNLNEQLIAARAREAAAGGLSVMQDGVIYANGFRIEPSQLNSNEDRKREIEAELERQKRIEEETRKQLAEAEAKLAEEHRKAKEEAEAKEQEKLAEAEQKRRQEEATENTRKLLEAEKQREAEERQKEEAERKETERKAIEENERKLLDAEKQRAEAERLRELAEQERAESERKLLEAETQRAAEQRKQEEEAQARRDAEIVERLLEAERARKLSATESELEEEEEQAAAQARRLIANEVDREQKQKLIDENARLFLEAEEEMVVLQQRLLEAAQADEYAGEVPVVEEPCVKKIVPPKFSETSSADDNIEPIVQKVKTQFGQKSSEHPYSVSAKPLIFPSVSDEGSSWEPISSQQSSFSTQPSDEVTTGAEEALRQRLDTERQEPDGEDNVPDVQYTDEYLRSLDGIKSRSLIREDGSGRRRAFKKRRSSGSSNSSRDSRASREEEVKMFTSLEEEELRQGEKDDYNPIKYTSEPTLRVKSHHRRQKRSPAKDGKRSEDDSLRGSLEMLGEESTNPWGEIVPEHYKETEFWKREKAMSIDEEEIDLGRPASGEGVLKGDDAAATNLPKASSFEEATHAQNEEAATALKQKQQQQRELSNEVVEKDTSGASKEPTSSSESNSNLIFSGEYTKAMDKDWHSGHFCCWQCDESLTGQRYVIRDDHPYCIKCYENVFANTCEECNKIIGIDSKDLSYKDKHWHEACFLCFKCHLSLVDKQFGAKADKIYCGNCYDAQFASRCDGCGEVFRAGTKKMEYKTRQWHENCFCCCVCKTAIGTKSFIPREQEIYCAGCYEEKFATRCIKCNKVITSGGVTYKNEPWHRECFTCTHCNITLAGQRFTSRDEKPYCAECFGELFAKRCTACVKPITGIGGTRFISFEDRHWHHDCFVCASCKTSLVGRGFITDGPDILCPDCAKQKLM